MPCQVDAQSALLQEAKELIHAICSDHVAAAQTFVKDDALRAEVSSQIEAECHELLEYIIAAKRFNLEANSRSKDRIISIGEKLSCKFMTYLLKDTVSSIQREPIRSTRIPLISTASLLRIP